MKSANFADEIGKWKIEGTSTSGDKTSKITAASVVLQKEDGARQDLKDQAERGT